MLENVSIIIPVAPDETSHDTLLGDLKGCGAEIIVSSQSGRAESLNQGAKKATRKYLWFLHADSRINEGNLAALENALINAPQSLHYFDLSFDGGWLTALNAIGANIRSRLFNLPYGDQGLCISKDGFARIGGYPERAIFGEDVLFIRAAKKGAKRTPFHPIRSKLITSARKYRDHGWAKLTLYRQWQLFSLLRVKI